VNAHQERTARANDYAPKPRTTDPGVMAHQEYQQLGGDAYPTADAPAQRAAQAAAGQDQKSSGGIKGRKVDSGDLARIIAEENEAKGKLPRYPGLERWKLLEKMGDGAFSNVYRAVDLEGNVGEVAIKVVRKFEMNSTQVSVGSKHILFHQVSLCALRTPANLPLTLRAILIFIRILKNSPRLLRCALTFFTFYFLLLLLLLMFSHLNLLLYAIIFGQELTV
jgi:hypothetical protein